MAEQWIDRRKGYRYSGFLFSEDGSRAKESGIEYAELPFAERASKRFRIWLALVLLITFPGIPLLAYLGLNEYLLWIAMIVGGIAYWLHGRIHACPQCGGKSRTLSTPHMGSPVLYLCPKCRTFFEHGEIDGGWPWK
jgi:hypothetical protein